MLCLSLSELYSRWVPLIIACVADTLNRLYRGLYKWFRRVRGPAATQATLITVDQTILGATVD